MCSTATEAAVVNVQKTYTQWMNPVKRHYIYSLEQKQKS